MDNSTKSIPSSNTPEGSQYSINPDGYIVSDNVRLSVLDQIFEEKPFILQIPNGLDIIKSVTKFAQRYELSVTVLCGHGLISEVDFTTPSDCISGCYQMVSFSGNYNCLNATSSGEIISFFTVSLVDAQGTLMGGQVISTMKAASDVKLVVYVTADALS